MCGLFGGLSTHLASGEIEKVLQLGYVSALRGTDSTGIAVGYRKKQGKFGVYTHKTVDHVADFLRDDDTIGIFKQIQPLFIIGHTRSATVGDVNVDNAHPHVVDHITGTHNGTISGFGNASKSDSRILFERVAREGITKAFSAADHGAYATVFADARARTINFFRNNARPLWMMWDTNKQLLLWASERGMLQMISDHDMNPTRFAEPTLLKPHLLYQVPFGSKNVVTSEIKIEKPSYYSYPRTTAFPALTDRSKSNTEIARQMASGSHSGSHSKVQVQISTLDEHNRPVKIFVDWNDPRAKAWANGKTPEQAAAEALSLLQASSALGPDPDWDNSFSNKKGEAAPWDQDTEENACPLPDFITTPKLDGRGVPQIHTTFEPLVKIKGDSWYDDTHFMASERMIIPTKEAKDILEFGCSCCGKPHTLAESEHCKWFTTTVFLCDTCKNDRFANQYVTPHLEVDVN